MKREKLITYLLLICLTACSEQQKSADRINNAAEFIRVSAKYSRYFETIDGRPWIPVMINFIIPNGEEAEVFAKTEMYFKHFSENGGNSMRIWISSPFLEIEDQKVGKYSQTKFNRIDSVLSLAQKYDIQIKFTLQHIRSIKPMEGLLIV
jgi:hypothetical protein